METFTFNWDLSPKRALLIRQKSRRWQVKQRKQKYNNTYGKTVIGKESFAEMHLHKRHVPWTIQNSPTAFKAFVLTALQLVIWDFSRGMHDIIRIQQVIQLNREIFSGVDWCRSEETIIISMYSG